MLTAGAAAPAVETQILLYPQDNLSPVLTSPLAGPSGRRLPGMWRSPSRPPAVVVDLA